MNNLIDVLPRFAARRFSVTGPWTCPTCGVVAHALVLVGDRWICDVDFRALRAKGANPEIRDAVIAASVP